MKGKEIQIRDGVLVISWRIQQVITLPPLRRIREEYTAATDTTTGRTGVISWKERLAMEVISLSRTPMSLSL